MTTYMEDQQIIFRKKDGTGFVDNGSVLSCIMHWDEFGAYLGQEQLNCCGGPDEPPILFFKAQGNQAGELGLTQEQMDNAVEEVSTYG